jgi:hypothetical protein
MMNGHTLMLHPEIDVDPLSIRMTFRQLGEDIPLWPSGVGSGEFKENATLDIAGQPAQRVLFICPSGEISSIYYHQGDGQPNIQRGSLEFGFIFSYPYCQPGYSLGGKVQRVGEMIIASLQVP